MLPEKLISLLFLLLLPVFLSASKPLLSTSVVIKKGATVSNWESRFLPFIEPEKDEPEESSDEDFTEKKPASETTPESVKKIIIKKGKRPKPAKVMEKTEESPPRAIPEIQEKAPEADKKEEFPDEVSNTEKEVPDEPEIQEKNDDVMKEETPDNERQTAEPDNNSDEKKKKRVKEHHKSRKKGGMKDRKVNF